MNNASDTNIEREILINHLYDVRALEIAKENLIKRVNQNTQKINQLGFHSQIVKPSKNAITNSFILAIFLSAILFAIACVTVFKSMLFERAINEAYVFMNVPESWYWKTVPRQPEFRNYVIIAIIATVVIGLLTAFIFSVSYFKRLSQYKKLIANDNQRVEKEINEKNELIKANNNCISEIKNLNSLLTETYSINIIPRQFRNLAGVYYLYDYMSTSQESLQSALFNYNVNKINVRMDKIIEQQSDMLIEQYVTNSKLEAMQNQNHRIMRQLSSIEQNSEITAKYSAITAANAKAITFFEGYKFFKND